MQFFRSLSADRATMILRDLMLSVQLPDHRQMVTIAFPTGTLPPKTFRPIKAEILDRFYFTTTVTPLFSYRHRASRIDRSQHRRCPLLDLLFLVMFQMLVIAHVLPHKGADTHQRLRIRHKDLQSPRPVRCAILRCRQHQTGRHYNKVTHSVVVYIDVKFKGRTCSTASFPKLLML